MRQTVVGVYDSYADACGAQRALIGAGLPQADILIYAKSVSASSPQGPRVYTPGGSDVRLEQPVFDHLDHLFARLFTPGAYPHETEDYRELIRRGGAVVSADVSEVQVDLTCDLMRHTGAVDIEERAKMWQSETEGRTAQAPHRGDESGYERASSDMPDEPASRQQEPASAVTVSTPRNAPPVGAAPSMQRSEAPLTGASSALGSQAPTAERATASTGEPSATATAATPRNEPPFAGRSSAPRSDSALTRGGTTPRDEPPLAEGSFAPPAESPVSRGSLSSSREPSASAETGTQGPDFSSPAYAMGGGDADPLSMPAERHAASPVPMEQPRSSSAPPNDPARGFVGTAADQLPAHHPQRETTTGISRAEPLSDPGGIGDPTVGPRLDEEGPCDDDFRSDYDARYASSGTSYDEYERAYEHGANLGRDERYRGHDWQQLEPGAREHWESRYPDSAWERFKAAVRHGWERVTGQS